MPERAGTANNIYSIAGNGTDGYSGDGGPATKSEIGEPEDVAMDSVGNLIIPDLLNNRVRMVAATSGTFYGVKMTAHDIYTVAGNGTLGFSGTGGPAIHAELFAPTQVAAGSAGNLFFGGDRVEEVSG